MISYLLIARLGKSWFIPLRYLKYLGHKPNLKILIFSKYLFLISSTFTLLSFTSPYLRSAATRIAIIFLYQDCSALLKLIMLLPSCAIKGSVLSSSWRSREPNDGPFNCTCWCLRSFRLFHGTVHSVDYRLDWAAASKPFSRNSRAVIKR